MVIEKSRVPTAGPTKSRIARASAPSTPVRLGPQPSTSDRRELRRAPRMSDQTGASRVATGIPAPRLSGRSTVTRARGTTRSGVNVEASAEVAPAPAVNRRIPASGTRSTAASPALARSRAAKQALAAKESRIPSPHQQSPPPIRRATTTSVPMPKDTNDPRCQSTLEYARGRAAAAAENAPSAATVGPTSTRTPAISTRIAKSSRAPVATGRNGISGTPSRATALTGASTTTPRSKTNSVRTGGISASSGGLITTSVARHGASSLPRATAATRRTTKPPTPAASPCRTIPKSSPFRPSDPNGRRAPPPRSRPSDPLGLAGVSPAKPPKLSMLPRPQRTSGKHAADGAPSTPTKIGDRITRTLQGSTAVVEERLRPGRANISLKTTPSRTRANTMTRSAASSTSNTSQDGAPSRVPLVESPYARGGCASGAPGISIRGSASASRRLDLHPVDDGLGTAAQHSSHGTPSRGGGGMSMLRTPDRPVDYTCSHDEDVPPAASTGYATPSRNLALTRQYDRPLDCGERHLSTGSERNLSSTSNGSRPRLTAVQSFRNSRRASLQRSTSQASSSTVESHRENLDFEIDSSQASDDDLTQELKDDTSAPVQPHMLRALLEELPSQSIDPGTETDGRERVPHSEKASTRPSSPAPWNSTFADSTDQIAFPQRDPLASEHADALRSTRSYGVTAALENDKHLSDRLQNPSSNRRESSLPDRIETPLSRQLENVQPFPDRQENGMNPLPDRVDPVISGAADGSNSTPQRFKRRKNSRFSDVSEIIDLTDVQKLRSSLNGHRKGDQTPTLRRSSVGVAVTGNLVINRECENLPPAPAHLKNTHEEENEEDPDEAEIAPYLFSKAVMMPRYGNFAKFEGDELDLANDEDVEDLGEGLN